MAALHAVVNGLEFIFSFHKVLVQGTTGHQYKADLGHGLQVVQMVIVEVDCPSLHRPHIADPDPVSRLQAAGSIKTLQIHLGEDGFQLLHGIEVVDQIHIAPVLDVQRGSGDYRLHVIDPLGVDPGCGLLLPAQGKKFGEKAQVGLGQSGIASGVEVFPHHRFKGTEPNGVLAGVHQVNGKTEAQEGDKTQLLPHFGLGSHQVVQGLSAINRIEILPDRFHPRLLPALGIHHCVVKGSDLGLGGSLLLRLGGNIGNEPGHLVVDLKHKSIKGAIDHLTDRNGRLSQPVLVDGGIEVVLQVGALIGIGPADERLQLGLCDQFLRRELSFPGTGHNTGPQHFSQFLLRPGRDIGEGLGRKGTPCIGAHRGLKAAEGPLQHNQGFRPGQWAFQVKIPCFVALQDVRHSWGDVVISGGSDYIPGLASGQHI